jgi:hypothetical protein
MKVSFIITKSLVNPAPEVLIRCDDSSSTPCGLPENRIGELLLAGEMW